MASERKAAGSRRSRVPHLADGKGKKKYPYSIKATARSVRSLWFTDGSVAQQPEEFAVSAATTFVTLCDKYKGRRSGDLAGLVDRVEGGQRDIRYFDLRLYAEVVGVPTTLYYLFTHIVGDIARDGDKDHAINLINSVIAGATALRDYIQSVDPNGSPERLKEAFIAPGTGADATTADGLPLYDADISSLRSMRDAFAQSRGQLYRRPDGLVG